MQDKTQNKSEQDAPVVQQKQVNQPGTYQTKQSNLPPIQTKQSNLPPIQTKQSKLPPIQTKQGKQGPIQAKQRPVERASSKSQAIAQAMGQQYGVDTSGLQFNHNSAFPSSVNAEATIQGSKIDFAPGKDTEHNIKHEIGHYIVNTQRGTPPVADAVVNGQKVNTTDETKADAIADTPLQRKATNEGTSTSTQQTGQSSVLQLKGDKDMSFGYYGRDGKRKSPKVVSMEEFGDQNRIHKVDPNKIREGVDQEDTEMLEQMGLDKETDFDKKTGIWVPSGSTARPEDAMLYQPVRKAYHKAHHIFLYLSKNCAMKEGAKNKIKEYQKRFETIGGNIKKASKGHKSKVRDFSDETSAKDLNTEYFEEMKLQQEVITKLQDDMLNYLIDSNPQMAKLKGKMGEKLLANVTKNAETQGQDVWRTAWHGTILQINKILNKHWANAEPAIEKWAEEKKEAGEKYMQTDYTYKLDYIGSLAKGYKSSAKQYLHFHPEKFDVDSALVAPHLALYVILQGEQSVDRGSVKSKGIEPLQKFEEATWDELQNVDGIDRDDPFEVFIRTTGVQELRNLDEKQKNGQMLDHLSDRYQAIKDRVWYLKMDYGTKYTNEFYDMFKEDIGSKKDMRDHNRAYDKEDKLINPGQFVNLNNIGEYENLYFAMETALEMLEEQAKTEAQEGHEEHIEHIEHEEPIVRNIPKLNESKPKKKEKPKQDEHKKEEPKKEEKKGFFAKLFGL